MEGRQDQENHAGDGKLNADLWFNKSYNTETWEHWMVVKSA